MVATEANIDATPSSESVANLLQHLIALWDPSWDPTDAPATAEGAAKEKTLQSVVDYIKSGRIEALSFDPTSRELTYTPVGGTAETLTITGGVTDITGKLDVDMQNVDINLNGAQKLLVRNAIGASDAIEVFRGTYAQGTTYRRGDIVQQNFRFWIAITTSGTNHANNTPPSAENHTAWRPVDGQFRTHTPGTAVSSYLRGDHLFVDDDLWFCRLDGNYTKAQILAGPQASPPTWEQLSGESGTGGTAVAANPAGTDGDDLNRILIAGSPYNVVGQTGPPGQAGMDGAPGADGSDGTGTVVAANPSGTDGDDLNRIAIGGSNYNVAGSGGGATPTATVVQLGTMTNAFHNTARAITLADGWEDYTKLLWVYAKADHSIVASAQPFVWEIEQWTSGDTLRFSLEQNDRLDITSVSGNTLGFLTINSAFSDNTDVLTVYGLSFGGLRGADGQDGAPGTPGQDGADGSGLITPDDMGNLPDASANAGKLALSGGHLLLSRTVVVPGHGRQVAYADYGRTGSGISPEELKFAGEFDDPPNIANYTSGAILWDRGSQIWLKKSTPTSTIWSGFSGPLGFIQGGVYADKATADGHVSAVGDVVVYGEPLQNQNVYVVTAYTAAHATHSSFQWVRIDVSPDELASAIARTQHGGDDSTFPGSYSSSKGYSRGQIVRDGGDLYILKTSTSTGQDPFQNPHIWAPLDGDVRWRGTAGSTAVKYYQGDMVLAGTSLYFCYNAPATNQTASTIPANTASFYDLLATTEAGISEAAARALIASWARSGNTGKIPVDKVEWAREFTLAGSGTQWEQGQIAQYTVGTEGKLFIVLTDHQQGPGDEPNTNDDFAELVVGPLPPAGDVDSDCTIFTPAANEHVQYTSVVPNSATCKAILITFRSHEYQAYTAQYSVDYDAWAGLPTRTVAQGSGGRSDRIDLDNPFEETEGNATWYVGKGTGGEVWLAMDQDNEASDRFDRALIRTKDSS